ncbi:MAG: diaminopimelate decarboxylase [Sphingobacteriaceae bacterium]
MNTFSPGVISQLAATESPCYYYDMTLLQATLKACKKAAEAHNFKVHYALKANFNEPILAAINKHGFGADCVSGNEVLQAIKTGFEPKEIVFAGVGKSDKEILNALQHDIFCFNVESVEELSIINELAASQQKTARIAIRINPNVDAKTHQYITTGLEENKFGVNSWELADCISVLKQSPNLELIGIHFHVGSQVKDLDVFKSLCLKVNEYNTWFAERGFNLQVLNVGGGLGVDYYQPDEQAMVDFAGYFAIFNQFLERKKGQEVHFELGRSLVAPCGTLISRVLYIKKGLKKNFMILDAGMTELMRPALYQAYHKIENLSRLGEKAGVNYDVVGPICESTDTFGKEVELPESFRGDLVAIRTAGAYGEVMVSRYNLREPIKAVYSA